MKIIIVNAYGRSNRGDSVLLDECLAEIKFGFPNADLSAVVFEGIDAAKAVHPDVKWFERIGNSSGQRLFAKVKTLGALIFGLLAARFPGFGWEKFLSKAQQETFTAIRESDIVVSAPGGYIHDTNFAYYVALFHIYIGSLLKKTVVLAPQSIGPLEGRMARKFAKFVLDQVPYICPRETYSLKFLLELGISSESIYQAGDSAFWNFDVSDNAAEVNEKFLSLGISSGQKILGMTVVSWSFPKSDNSPAAYEKYVDSVVKVAEHFSEVYGVIPVIFNQVSEDLNTAMLVKSRARCKIIVDTEEHEPRVLRAMISRSVIFLGTRFHSCIFALMAGCPIFAIAYLPKTEFIMNDLKLSHRYISIDSVDVDRVVSQLAMDFQSVESARSDIKLAVTNYQKDFLRFRDILSIVSSNGNFS